MPVWEGKPYKYTKPDLPPSERDQIVHDYYDLILLLIIIGNHYEIL